MSESVNVYKMFIDNLVEESQPISSKLVIEEGIYTKSLNSTDFNEFVSKLTYEQKLIFSKILQKERVSAIHDTLVQLTELIDVYDVTLCHKNEAVETDISGMGLHGDYIGRLDDWKWPEK